MYYIRIIRKSCQEVKLTCKGKLSKSRWSDFTKRLEKQVKNVKTSAKWRLEYMKLELKLYETREAGREEGIALTKAVFRLDSEGYALSDIAVALSVSEDEVRRILEE